MNAMVFDHMIAERRNNIYLRGQKLSLWPCYDCRLRGECEEAFHDDMEGASCEERME